MFLKQTFLSKKKTNNILYVLNYLDCIFISQTITDSSNIIN